MRVYAGKMLFRISLFLLALQALFAQVQSGTIVGTITDQGGAVVSGVQVTLVNDGTKFTRTVITNNAGQYVATSIPTGAYTLSAEMAGFQKLLRTGVQLTAADTVAVDLQLKIGNVQETVEVKETAPLLQSQTATVSSLVSNQQMVEMPLNGRTFTALLKLSPGAYTGSSSNLTSSPYAMRGDVNISVNGSSANTVHLRRSHQIGRPLANARGSEKSHNSRAARVSKRSSRVRNVLSERYWV